MFNNFVNIHDFFDVLRKSKKVFSKMSALFMKSDKDRVKDNWSATEYPPNNWWDVPEVLERWNKLMTGDSEIDYYKYINGKYFLNRNNLVGISVGCGTGHRELKWARTGKFKLIDAFDLAKERIDFANKKAIEEGYSKIIKYQVGDINEIQIPKSYYDVVFIEQSLHHFSPLMDILKKIETYLKPDGLLVINEFVGPNRLQWPQKQIDAINGILSILPKEYKVLWKSDKIKLNIFKPSKLRMIITDPSEAIESSNIRRFLDEVFTPVEIKEYGGNILHMLLNGIAHNFLNYDSNSKKWLDLFFRMEDLLLADKELESDFILGIYKKQR